MSEWIYFLHPPRENFIATMTNEERATMQAHKEWIKRLFDDGILILSGPCLGTNNTGLAIFEAPDEATARRIIEDEPVAGKGLARGELRPFRLGLMRSYG